MRPLAEVSFAAGVTVALLDVEVEVAGRLEGRVRHRRTRCHARPVPGAGRMVDDIAGCDDVYAVLVGHDGLAFDEHQVLTGFVGMWYGSNDGVRYPRLRRRAPPTRTAVRPGRMKLDRIKTTSSSKAL
jgi:hypothetical protein